MRTERAITAAVFVLLVGTSATGQSAPPALGALQTNQASNAPTGQAPKRQTILYAASWCGYCRQARAYLARSKVPYQEIDIDTSQGKADFAKYGNGGVPLLVSNGETLRGYSELAYDYFFASQR